MSETADTIQAATEDASAHDFIELKSMEDVEKLEQTQIYAYIEKLHGIIRKYDTKIASYKQKLKHFVRFGNGKISLKKLKSKYSCSSIRKRNVQMQNWRMAMQKERRIMAWTKKREKSVSVKT